MAHISNVQDQDGWQDEDSDDDLEEEDELSSDEEVLPLRYDSGCQDLPTARPVGYPHIIVSRGFNEQTDKTDLRLADGIATLLWKWNPEHLKAFFDMSKPRFEMLRKNGPGMIKYTMIARLDRIVIAGFMNAQMDWDPQFNYQIEADGKWTPVMCSEIPGANAKYIEHYGKEFAMSVLYDKLWEEGAGVEFKVEEN